MSKTYILGQDFVKHDLVPWNEVKTMQQFYDRMKAHDWHSTKSDDYSVWQKGKWSWENEFEPCLERMKKSHGEQALMLFAAMRAWAWGSGELPERPDE
jgi:hypothetical protein